MLHFKKIIIYTSTILLVACQTTLPDLSNRTPSIYIPTVRAEKLERALQLPPLTAADTKAQSDESSSEPKFNAHTYILDSAQDAFAARIKLIENAETSIDTQYYIWHNDISGSLLLQKLYQAAERGVRVRLLLDDNNTRGMDDVLMVMNQHPKIEVRLFNPFLNRRWRALGYLHDFPRVNRRMHNKSLTADNRASIIGGRNIGDEYFDVGDETVFSDVDVLVSGGIVTRISQEFDRYWRSQSSYPIESIVKKYNIARGEEKLRLDYEKNPVLQHYQQTLQAAPIIQAASGAGVPYIAAQAQLVSDDPAKALDRNVQVDINAEMRRALGTPQREMYLVSPYFVPTQSGVAMLRDLEQKGVATTVLTNSLRATDVAAVHSGYLRYRKPLLQSGVKLYELKSDGSQHPLRDKGLTGNSSTSLHTKTFIVDKERMFVGSFNLDPRSARLNTEMGLVLHNPQLAQQMEQRLHEQAQHNAYHVSLNEQGKLQWHDPQNADALPSHREPEASFWKRAISRVLSWLPIERLL
ncbi:phospholipase D family protein [Wielerella bovis]|uniref:phospholipase D family protein n=1 Tax=Wielerella bovis TaxID=2917790 RepID=UPI002019B90D|nr:phospholipase D family protein [Wielerella bovis]MCG7657726.1 phospholipase D family protein [Wielerella bovis]MCG7659947.1 phospholipase D family protein [Wielerella bovis]